MPLSLNIPFFQRNEARQKGVQWDALNKTWYVPDEFNEALLRFEKWFAVEKPDLIIPGGPILISAPTNCPHCNRRTVVFGLGTAGAYTNQSLPSSKEWVYDFEWGHIFGIREMDKGIQRVLKSECPNFYKDKSYLYGGKFWINHCDHCGRQISDDLLYRYNGSALFCPPDRAATIDIFTKDLEMDYFTCYRGTRNFYWDMYNLYNWVFDRESNS
jgi:hypothetical protein